MVFDLRQKFGIDPSDQTQPGNLIITTLEPGGFAFWIDQILDVFEFPLEGWGNLPAAIPRGIFSRTLLLNKKIHLYSEFEKLMTIDEPGYLGQYIQQLKQQNAEKPAPEDILQEQKISAPESSTSNTSLETVAKIKPDEIKDKPGPPVEKEPTPKEIHPEVITPALPQVSGLKNNIKDSRVRAEDKTDHDASIKKTTDIIEKIQPITTRPLEARSQQFTAVTKTGKPQRHDERKESEKIQPPQKISYLSDSNLEDENKTSAFGFGVFIILLLTCLGAGIYYLLPEGRNSRETIYKTKKPISITRPKPIITQIDKPMDTQPVEPPVIIPEEKDISPEPAITGDAKVGNSDNQNNRIEDTPTGLIIVKDAEADIPDSDGIPIEDTNYRADITQQDNEIIITIRKPVYTKSSAQPETLMPTPKLEEEPVEEIELEKPPKELQNAEDLNKITPDEISIKEVIHTVVKGDTLWAIAKKYVNDPFLYPELARLSNIKNPHRIYPGNRVRIRFIEN